MRDAHKRGKMQGRANITSITDLFVIGGGINGAGIARDAAGRGLSVILCEKDDLAQGTSSRSGKLIHGGLRYLEYYEFRLVREALIEREVLLNSAPHIIWPMRFVLPHSPDDRPAWLIRLGLFLYDNLGGRKQLPGTRTLNLRQSPEGAPIKDKFKIGFEYSDCWVDDARLVVLNAVAAAEKGAEILTRTAFSAARCQGNLWQIQVTNTTTGKQREMMARAIVNAGGPWVNDIIDRMGGAKSARNVRLVKGSHIIVQKFWEGQQAYLVQNHDKRVIFINPYEGNQALIGTTDIPYDGTPENVSSNKGEIDYLIAAVNRYFKQTLRREDVVESFSGVRPLFDDGKGNPSAVTRNYVFDLDTDGGAPILNIFGGKITTFRKLAEHAMQRLNKVFPEMGKSWTAKSVLPGGEIENVDFYQFLNSVQIEFPWLPRDLARHYGRLYGTRLKDLLGQAKSMNDLGIKFGPHLYEVEVRYLIRKEWATSPEDILYRRTKHGLHLSDYEKSSFAIWYENNFTKPAKHPPTELAILQTTSTEIGTNPMLIQSAGGNVSIKDGNVMWIKASGTSLAEAEEKDIFVAVDLVEIRKALRLGERCADNPAKFLMPGGANIRPSIETSLHAIFPHKVVLHAHCVHTLAHAVRVDREILLKARLNGLNWALVPYLKPGANLARAVTEKIDDKINVIVLGNHGLIVAGETVEQTRDLLYDVHARLKVTPGAEIAPDVKRLKAMAQFSRYVLPEYTLLHQLALNPDRIKQAVSGSLYPDHVIFCGIAATALNTDEMPNQAERRVVATGATPPVFLIAPRQGVLVHKDASRGALALMRCLVDVLVRIPSKADIHYLSHAENLELLNWDAEKYRRTRNSECG